MFAIIVTARENDPYVPSLADGSLFTYVVGPFATMDEATAYVRDECQHCGTIADVDTRIVTMEFPLLPGE